ncbi:MAG: GspH/FimT family pseudopilin [Parcubacteria group bacterium]|nr:GspH/FimT family pseudopilin [Parcubacteria group bacterium]
MQKFKNKFKALTLIELLAVIAIMGVLASISAGFIRAYQPNIKLYTETRQLHEALEEARSRTIAEQQAYGVRFFREQGRYELVSLEGAGTVIGAYTLPNEVWFASIAAFENDTAQFNKAGAARESGDVALQNSNSDQRTVSINPSGYIETK